MNTTQMSVHKKKKVYVYRECRLFNIKSGCDFREIIILGHDKITKTGFPLNNDNVHTRIIHK